MHRPVPAIASSAPVNQLRNSVLIWLLVVAIAGLAIGKLRPPQAVADSAPLSEFSAQRALAHVSVIARVPHPLVSAANDVVREYLLSQLRTLGFSPQVLDANGINNAPGRITIAHTRNIVARLNGTASTGAVLLMAHYDSVASAPGAADDAAGVASILEALRAVRTGPALKNDVIVLFTDGEEAGLLGADAFTTSQPWMKEVGLVMNFEARGNRGASLLFETSRNNQHLIKAVAHSAPYPIGSSLFFSLYKLLPNDTDLTVFQHYNTPALNFAFGEDLDAYHSALDTAANLSPASLQHHGSYALALTRYFGNSDLEELKNASNDDVFFDWLGSRFVAYNQRWVIPGQGIATLLLCTAVILCVRSSSARIGRILLALISSTALLIIVPAVLGSDEWIISRILARRMIVSDSAANSVLLISLLFLAAAVASLGLVFLCRRFRLQELAIGSLSVVCALNWAVALLLPTGSYVLFWPLLLCAAGLVIAELGRNRTPSVDVAAAFPGFLVSVLLIAPIIYLLYVFLTLQLITAFAIGILFACFILVSIPVMDIAVPRNRWKPVFLVLLGCWLITAGIGVTMSGHSPQHPQHDTILYSLDTDAHNAAWISLDSSADRWTTQFFGSGKLIREKVPDYLYGSERPVLSTPAPAVDLNAPVSEVKVDQHEAELYKVRIKLKSRRNAEALLLGFSKDVQLLSVDFQGRTITARHGSGNSSITLLGMGPDAVDIDLTLKTPHVLSFWIADRSPGLPVNVQPRPSLFVAGQISDFTLVGRKLSL